MQQISKRLSWILTALFLFTALQCCEEQGPPEFDCLDTGNHYLLIVPESPTSNDIIVAIDTICGSESDAVLDFQGQQITFTRYVNSLIMMPCLPRTDTTVVGQLNRGQYRLVHRLIDKNHLLTDSIILLDTICLLVK
jgi:hypothetical protein